MAATSAPQREEDVLELVRWALSARQPLRVAGLDTKQGFGLPAPEHHQVSLRRLSGILMYEPEELVMRAAPGTPLEEVEAALEARGQHLAFEPLHAETLFGADCAGTIGGVFAANLSGPRRFRAGAARDHLLGVRAVSGRGETWRSGGRVIKNVTGYDLSKLMAGSWGELSVLTELTFKVLPRPEIALTLARPLADVKEAVARLMRLAGSPLEPSGLAFLPEDAAAATGVLPGGDGFLLVRLEGTRAGVEDRARALPVLLPSGPEFTRVEGEASTRLWQAIRDVAPLATSEVIVKLSLLASAVPRLLEALPANARWFVDAAGTWLWIGLPAEGAAGIVQSLRAQLTGRGSCVVWRAPPATKHEAGILTPQEPALAALSRRLKQAFDPDGILGPGRLMPA